MCIRLRLMARGLIGAALLVGVGGAGAQAQDATAGFVETLSIAAPEDLAALIQLLGEQYTTLHPRTAVTMVPDESASGIGGLLDGKCQIVALVRPANRSERNRVASRLGAELVGTPIARGAIAIYVNSVNPLGELTIEQLRSVLRGKLVHWSDLGLEPGRDIYFVLPEAGVGLLEVLEAKFMGRWGIRKPLEKGASTQGVVDAVAGTPGSLGIGAMGYASRVKVLALKMDADEAPVLPSAQTVVDGTYPLVHYLYLYTVGQPTGHAREFIRMSVSAIGQRVVREAGPAFAPLPVARDTSSATGGATEPNNP